MTPAELEHDRIPTGNVNINVTATFAFFLLLPYLLFFGLLMLITGQINIVLLFDAVTEGHSMVVVKAWVIGTFVLSVAGALYLTYYRTKKYIARHMAHTPDTAKRNGSAPVHFVIESREAVEASEASKARHTGLEDVIGDKAP